MASVQADQFSMAMVATLECRLLYEPAPGISTNLDFLSFGKFYANSDFTSKIFEF